ncbi:MAG: GIY-YIG nuclease family protein [Planctomycetes bacterium]|nr:GIY-YIG nuclease family protein [Planctomycetota bacterium]
MWGVYILECSDGTLYSGVTNDMDKRLEAHNSGKGARYTRGRLPVKLLVFSGLNFTHGEALRHELALKRLPRARKMARIEKLSHMTPES